MQGEVISDQEFRQFQSFIYEAAGITLSSAKKPLICGRLAKRLRHHGIDSYSGYLRLLQSGQAPGEVQTAVDLLTTNETYFFREAKHFTLLRKLAKAGGNAEPFRVWSAASSSGEEAYSIAMVLADCRAGAGWEVLGSDISSRVLERAHRGQYPLERGRHISPEYLKRFCLRGVGAQQGTLLVTRELRKRVRFLQVNLNASLPDLGAFDVIFLRNVLIYFNEETKRKVVARLGAVLKPGGYLLIGHSESLHGLGSALEALAPSVYRRGAGRPGVGA